MKFKQQLKAWRRSKKLSQDAAAKRLTTLVDFPHFSICTRTFENWEQGVREPNQFTKSIIEKVIND